MVYSQLKYSLSDIGYAQKCHILSHYCWTWHWRSALFKLLL